MTWIPFDGGDEFYTNTTSEPVKLTISIKNTTTSILEISLQEGKGKNRGLTKKIGDILMEKTRTFTIEIPAGAGLYGSVNGEFLIH